MSLIESRLSLKQRKVVRTIRRTSTIIHRYKEQWQHKQQKGYYSLRRIKHDIEKNKDLNDFWQGELNEQLMIDAEALEKLKAYLTTRMHHNLGYFEAQNADKLTNDSVIMFIYHKWLQLALCEDHNLHPFCESSLIATTKSQFHKQKLDIKTFAIEVLAQSKEPIKPESYEEPVGLIKQ
ncbi:hypothetical protein [Thiomicrospira microaerophila]|uniref:hypothetical protein n=1 Tax=Thiomicrospira microaerophila TaxID=406020 RepID=UPI0005C887C1|nr:hypothetical protein [Thiomicrospira microaerophila]